MWTKFWTVCTFNCKDLLYWDNSYHKVKLSWELTNFIPKEQGMYKWCCDYYWMPYIIWMYSDSSACSLTIHLQWRTYLACKGGLGDWRDQSVTSISIYPQNRQCMGWFAASLVPLENWLMIWPLSLCCNFQHLRFLCCFHLQKPSLNLCLSCPSIPMVDLSTGLLKGTIRSWLW